MYTKCVYYSVLHLNFYYLNVLNRFDVSRKLNKVKNKHIAYYVYQGRYKYWFINQEYVSLILKKNR